MERVSRMAEQPLDDRTWNHNNVENDVLVKRPPGQLLSASHTPCLSGSCLEEGW